MFENLEFKKYTHQLCLNEKMKKKGGLVEYA